jgi:hypothetical protein
MIAAILRLGAAGVCNDTASLAPQHDSIPYPQGYRTWAHVKKVVVGSQRQVVACATPARTRKPGKDVQPACFREGTTLVFDLLEASEVEENNIEGAR